MLGSSFFRNVAIKKMVLIGGGLGFAMNLIAVIGTLMVLPDQANEVSASGRNRMLSQKIALYASQYVQSGDEKPKELCREAMIMHNITLHTMETGGFLPEVGKLKPASGEAEIYLLQIQSKWGVFKKQVEILLEEPLYIEREVFNLNINLDTVKTDDVKLLRVIEEKNPLVLQSLDYILNNAEDLLSLNDSLSAAYTHLEKQDATKVRELLWFFLFLNLTLVVTTFLFMNQHILRPVERMAVVADKIAHGNFTEFIEYEGRNEIAKMADALGFVFDKFKNVSSFMLALGKGDFETDIEALKQEEYKNDPFMMTLVETRDKLHQAKKESDERVWMNNGLTELSRTFKANIDNVEELGRTVILQLIKFLDVTQGAVYMLNESSKEGEKMEMIGCYAFDRFNDTRNAFRKGEGLLGEVWAEGEITHLTEIPNSYMTIKSGLGDDHPQSLLIVPLKVGGIVIGVIELASFKYQFEERHLRFMDLLSTSIASDLMIYRNTNDIKQMYDNTKEITKSMEMKEKDLQFKIDNLNMAKDTMEREVKDMSVERSLLKDVADKASIAIFITDKDGYIEYTNQALEQIVGYKAERMKGASVEMFLDIDGMGKLLNSSLVRCSLLTKRKVKVQVLMIISHCENERHEEKLIFYLQDMTEYHNLHTEMEKLGMENLMLKKQVKNLENKE